MARRRPEEIGDWELGENSSATGGRGSAMEGHISIPWNHPALPRTCAPGRALSRPSAPVCIGPAPIRYDARVEGDEAAATANDDDAPTRIDPGDRGPPDDPSTGPDAPLAASIGEVLRARLRRSGDGGRLGRYIILRLLGEGGMGLVFAAYDEELDRKVAIKLLRSDGPAGRLDRGWLLAEAKAMARLSHPNVVQIYDVGELEGQVFVAMELVAGASLRDWLRQEPRDAPAILRAFLDAGRGLQAIHEAGLVHRDFKPQNVLVAADGRARVLDFGLAHPRADPGDAPAAASGGATGSYPSLAPTGATATPATTGRVAAGTPAYMPPEQHAGLPTDARSDLFAFCVALYEALYGRRPFAGRGSRELAAAIQAGAVQPPPPDTRVPAWIRRILLRGLAPDPAARWPSMAALLDALGRDPWQRRRRALAALAVALALAAALGLALHYRALAVDPELDPCAGGPARLAGAWGPDRRDAAAAAFRATALDYAEDTWSKTQERMDRYAETWLEAHRDACQDHRRGELSPALYDRAAACLDGARRDLAALAAALAAADAAAVERAAKAADKLPALDLCLRRDALAAQIPPPEPAAAAAVEAIRQDLAAIRADLTLSRPGRCAELAALQERGGALAYPPLAAELLAAAGACAELAGDYEAAATALAAAIHDALAAGHDLVAAEAGLRLAHILSYRLARYPEAALWVDLIDALAARLARDDLADRALIVRGAIALTRGAAADALRDLDAAIARLERRPGPPSLELAAALNNRVAANSTLGARDHLTADVERALAIYRERLGPSHPDVALVLSNLGNLRFLAGDLDGALAAQQEALALKERLLGPDHPDIATIASNLGAVHQRRGDFAAAKALYERAVAIRERALGPDNPNTANVLANLGEVLNDLERPAEARPLLLRALAARERAQGPDHPLVAGILSRLGRADLRLGRPKDARRHLERAAAIGARGGVQPEELRYTDLYLARARWETARSAKERAAARALAEATRAALDPRTNARELAELDAWLTLAAR